MKCTKTYTNHTFLQDAAKANCEAFHKRLKQLYPCVEDVSKLPHGWSDEKKASQLGITSDKLGCWYRGGAFDRREDDERHGACVRTDRFIPPSCLLYYFELKFASNGRDGFMGIGLASASTMLDKLPGWARDSYGFHADDGRAFRGEGGQSLEYGPTFTSGDVIGCGYNLVEGKCFFTKNGLNLGTAFENMQSNALLYPIAGLKSACEEVRANFGHEQFVYDIEQDLRSLRKNMTLNITYFPVTDFGIWQETLHKLVLSWLSQNSYPNTAEAFTKATRIEFNIDNMQRIQERYSIQQLVLNGRISEAVKSTNRCFPNLLRNNPNLLFALKCRQFVELINGAETDYQSVQACNESESNTLNGFSKMGTNGDHSDATTGTSSNSNPNNGCNGMIVSNSCEKNDDQHSISSSSFQELMDIDQPQNSEANETNNHNRCTNDKYATQTSPRQQQYEPQQQQQYDVNSDKITDANGVCRTTPPIYTEMDFNEQKFAKLLTFGQDLNDHLQRLNKYSGRNETNEKMLQGAVSLLAFVNPKSSDIGKLLDPSEREPVSQLLNNAILKAEMEESHRPPANENLEEVMNHLRKLVRLNNSHGRWLFDHLYT